MHTTLAERVDELVRANGAQLRATTPTSIAIGELADRIETLEQAVRELEQAVGEIAHQVERISDSPQPSLLDDSVARRFRRSI